jgi:hypothetical protein
MNLVQLRLLNKSQFHIQGLSDFNNEQSLMGNHLTLAAYT